MPKALKLGGLLTEFPDASKELTTDDGKKLSLKSFVDKNVPFVVFFYPKAGTGVCTKEACGFRDAHERFGEEGVTVVGVSSDTPQANAAWKATNGLPYTLLSDEGGAVRKGLGVKGNMLGLVPGRHTYVFDRQGKCILSFNNQLNGEKHVQQALETIALLQAK